MSYLPGTLLRFYTDDSKHYTATVLKNGQLLEVKNPELGGKKEVFATVEEWCLNRNIAIENVKVDITNASRDHILNFKDTHGFNYPTEKFDSYKWVQWLYSILDELAPHLLLNEKVKEAYNQMVTLCNEFKFSLRHHIHSYLFKQYHYSPNNIKWTEEQGYDGWHGYPGNLGLFGRSSISYDTVSDKYKEARSRVLDAYKKLLDLIEPHIIEPMAAKHKIVQTRYKLKNYKQALRFRERNYTFYENKLKSIENDIKAYKNKIVELEGSLA